MLQDANLEEDELNYTVKGGCAAVVSIFFADKLYVANAGDCRFEPILTLVAMLILCLFRHTTPLDQVIGIAPPILSFIGWSSMMNDDNFNRRKDLNLANIFTTCLDCIILQLPHLNIIWLFSFEFNVIIEDQPPAPQAAIIISLF